MAALGSWEEVATFALALPGTERGTYYGGPAVKLAANGRPLVTPSREEGSFCLHVPQTQKAMMLDVDPDRFWQTAHYDGWPALLVRYGPAEGAGAWIARAADLQAALKPASRR